MCNEPRLLEHIPSFTRLMKVRHVDKVSADEPHQGHTAAAATAAAAVCPT